MTLATINDLAALASPASTDLIGVWSVSGAAYKKSTVAQVLAAGSAAIKTSSNTFTAAQPIAPASTGAPALNVNAPAGNGAVQVLSIGSFDNGAGIGPGIYIGRNSNASTKAGAHIGLTPGGSGTRFIWVDGAGLARIHTAAPTSATDTAGTVVGDQTSMLAAKTLAANDVAPIDEVLRRISEGADAVRRWTYKDGEYNGEEFEGIVTDFAPAYGKDRDKEHPNGKALNNVVILGDLVRAVANLAQRVSALE